MPRFTATVALREVFDVMPNFSAIHVELDMHRASAVDVRLMVPRGLDLLGQGNAARSYASLPGIKAQPNIFHIDVGIGLLTLEDLQVSTLVVESTGETASVSAIVLETPDAWAVGRPYEGCVGSGDARYHFERVSKPADPPEIGPEEYVKLMQERLCKESRHPLTPAKRFFFLLDCATHPFLQPLGESERENAKTNLIMRCERRAGLLVKRQCLHIDLPDQIIEFRGLFCLYRRLVKEGFTSPIPDHKAAMIEFARGATRFRLLQRDGLEVGMWTTQPSSGYFFLFAELLLLAAQDAVTNNRDPQEIRFWCHAAEGAILAQPVFAAAFGKPDVVERGWNDFDPCHRHCVPQQILDDAKAAMTPIDKEPSFDALILRAAQNARSLLPALVAHLRSDEPLPPSVRVSGSCQVDAVIPQTPS